MPRTIVLSIDSNKSLTNKIPAIKGVRGLTGMGLKDAKELVESVHVAHPKTILVPHDVLEPDFSQQIDAIKTSGLNIQVIQENNPARKAIAEQIRQVITFSNMAAQYDVAKALIDVIETYCPAPSDDLVIPEEFKE